MPTESTSNVSLTRRRALTALGLAGAGVAAVGGLAACSGDKKPTWTGSGSAEPGKQEESGETPPLAKVTISSPAADAVDVPASGEIVFAVEGAPDAAVKLTDAAGAEIPGAMHPDGAGWIPTATLQYGTKYTATVTATGSDGKAVTSTAAFTTMAKPGNVLSVSSFLADNAVIGCAMPLIFRLSRSIPKANRAAFQRRLLVETTPAQEGIWTWYNDTEMHWRPREFWKSGTEINVKVQVGGLPVGNDFYGKRNSTLVCTVGPALVMTVNDSNKQMVVTKDGKVIKTIPVSLGKTDNLSSSGTTVIIEKKSKTVFDTFNDPTAKDRYRTEVEWAQRLTWGGEFIHAAPWSVASQGRRNVSHGCINMSTANAKWLFGQTKVGDPVITKGTKRKLVYGNGWTDWDKTWEEYVKGSAIPYVAPTTAPEPAPSIDPSAAPSPAPSA